MGPPTCGSEPITGEPRTSLLANPVPIGMSHDVSLQISFPPAPLKYYYQLLPKHLSPVFQDHPQPYIHQDPCCLDSSEHYVTMLRKHWIVTHPFSTFFLPNTFPLSSLYI